MDSSGNSWPGMVNSGGSPSFNNPNDDFFTNASANHNGNSNNNNSNYDIGSNDVSPGNNNETSPDSHRNSNDGDLPRMKRIACVVCRRRKLKCDGIKPSCGTCSRLGHDCSYDEVRRKSGPKRGYVKALEARLAQVETLLKTQDPADAVYGNGDQNFSHMDISSLPDFNAPPSDHGISSMLYVVEKQRAESQNDGSLPIPDKSRLDTTLDTSQLPDMMGEPSLSWDMMQMGLDEALPEPNVIDDLHRIYFDKVAPSHPILHKGRYLANLNLAPASRPPIALRYVLWTLAASVSEEYSGLQTIFYRRARKYAEEAELKGHGESIISISFAQAWTLLATYEFKLMYFPRAWLSTGRAVRLCQMMGVHRLDGLGLDVKQCLAPPKDWIEREERRRTFWMAFCVDRYASIGTGWPMVIDEKDILTNLPASEDSFESGRPARTICLKEATTDQGAAQLSAFASVVLMAALFGRNLIHLHRTDPDDRDDDVEQGEFWRRHRHMDNILINTSLSLPAHLKLPHGIMDPNIIFTNMNIHTSTICLHQAAIFKADKNRLPPRVSNESKHRCIVAAAHIASIMKMISSQDLSGMNPFVSFCLYVAARVFVQYLKSRPNDDQIRSSLQFLLSAMGHLKKMNPLTESFLVQLDVDLSASMDEPANNSKFPYTLKKGAAEIYVPIDEKLKQKGVGHANQFNSPPEEPLAPVKEGNSSANFLHCGRTVMSISQEKLTNMHDLQNRMSPLSEQQSPNSLDMTGTSREPSEHATPNQPMSQQSPLTEPFVLNSFNSQQAYANSMTNTSMPDIHSMGDLRNLSGMNSMQGMGGIGPMHTMNAGMNGMGNFNGVNNMSGMSTTTLHGMTSKDQNSYFGGDPFDLDNLTADQSEAIFSEMLSMSSPSQWLNTNTPM